MRMTTGLELWYVLIQLASSWTLPDRSGRSQLVMGEAKRGQQWLAPIDLVVTRPPSLENPVPEVFDQASRQGVGRLPALGFNSWNAYHCDINETKFLDAANKIIDLGLKDAGYEYVNIDDCWSIRDRRDPDTGWLIPDTAKFPDGIAGLADKVHDLGLKIGIYSSAGDKTCAGYPASLEHEEQDAKAFAEWGIDYLKYDNCNFGSIPGWQDECEYCQKLNATCQDTRDVKYCPEDYDYSRSRSAERFARMRDALHQVERPILYSLCQWGKANVNTWANNVGQSWRTTDDIEPHWDFVLRNLNQNTFALRHADFYSHPDPDMLEIGNGLSPTQERTHFALWAAMKSPLLIGTDLNKISSASLELLKTKTLLDFNQDDTYGKPAEPFRWGTNEDWTFDDEHPAEYWSGQFKGGIMVLLFNNNEQTSDMTFSWSEVPQIEAARTYRIVDGWNEDRDYGCFEADGTVTFADIAAHDTEVLVLKQEECENVLNPNVSEGNKAVRIRWPHLSLDFNPDQ